MKNADVTASICYISDYGLGSLGGHVRTVCLFVFRKQTILLKFECQILLSNIKFHLSFKCHSIFFVDRDIFEMLLVGVWILFR